MIVADKKVNENTICNEDSVDVNWTSVYNYINWENNDFKYWEYNTKQYQLKIVIFMYNELNTVPCNVFCIVPC